MTSPTYTSTPLYTTNTSYSRIRYRVTTLHSPRTPIPESPPLLSLASALLRDKRGRAIKPVHRRRVNDGMFPSEDMLSLVFRWF